MYPVIGFTSLLENALSGLTVYVLMWQLGNCDHEQPAYEPENPYSSIQATSIGSRLWHH
jgi:hypothetical protein